MTANPTKDPRTDSQKIEMAQHFEAFEFEYREDPDTDAEVVHEDDDVIVVADHSGLELNEWASDFGIDRGDLQRTFRAIADKKMGDREAHEAFSYSDPVVFDKIEE